MLCACCQNNAVPEAGYNICEKRRGLIPLTLEPLVNRRKKYKQRMKSADEETRAIYDARRVASTAAMPCLTAISRTDVGT